MAQLTLVRAKAATVSVEAGMIANNVVGARDGALEILEVQSEGKKMMALAGKTLSDKITI